MPWRDGCYFFALFAAVLVAFGGMCAVAGLTIDEYDILHVVILAATFTIIRAVREEKT